MSFHARIATTSYSYIEITADAAEELEQQLTELKDLKLVEKASALSPPQQVGSSSGYKTSSPGGGSATDTVPMQTKNPKDSFSRKDEVKAMGAKWENGAWNVPSHRVAEAEALGWVRK